MTADFLGEQLQYIHNSYISKLDKCLSPKFVEILMVSNNCVESLTKRKHPRFFRCTFGMMS